MNRPAARGSAAIQCSRAQCSCRRWYHTLNAVRTTLDEMKKAWPDIEEATAQSDGAGNYDCTGFMISVRRVFEAVKTLLRRHVVTEVGDGKNLVDTDFQQAQMALNHGLDGGRNFEDAQGIVDTLEANKTLGVVNVGMNLGSRSLEPKKGQGPKAYAGIDSFYDRVRCSHIHHCPNPHTQPPSPSQHQATNMLTTSFV